MAFTSLLNLIYMYIAFQVGNKNSVCLCVMITGKESAFCPELLFIFPCLISVEADPHYIQ